EPFVAHREVFGTRIGGVALAGQRGDFALAADAAGVVRGYDPAAREQMDDQGTGDQADDTGEDKLQFGGQVHVLIRDSSRYAIVTATGLNRRDSSRAA